MAMGNAPPAQDAAATPLDDSAAVTLSDPSRIFFTLLDKLEFSIALSTDSARLIIIGAKDLNPSLKVLVLPGLRGLAAHGAWIAAGSFNGVSLFKNVPGLASTLPEAPGTCDAVYVPRALHYTGRCDFHDMAFVDGNIVAVNTRYSCVCTVDGTHTFTPIWKPPFISAILPQDRCHLNGMAIDQGKLRYVTMLGQSDETAGWRETYRKNGGILMDATTGQVTADGLALPHSPRLIQDKLYCLESGEGRLLLIDPATGQRETVATLPGFAHGMVEHKGILFIAVSKLRQRKSVEAMPIEQKGQELIAGVMAIELATHRQLAMLVIKSGLYEIYDLQILPGIRNADIRGANQSYEHHAVELPYSGFWAKDPPGHGSGAREKILVDS